MMDTINIEIESLPVLEARDRMLSGAVAYLSMLIILVISKPGYAPGRPASGLFARINRRSKTSLIVLGQIDPGMIVSTRYFAKF